MDYSGTGPRHVAGCFEDGYKHISFRKVWGICQLSEELLISQEGLSSTE